MLQCIVNAEKPISSGVSTLIYRTAKRMAKEKRLRLRFKNAECEGVLSTKWEYGTLGGITGILFTADMAGKTGENAVTFIARTLELEINEDNWHPFEDEHALAEAVAEYEAYELRHSGKKLN